MASWETSFYSWLISQQAMKPFTKTSEGIRAIWKQYHVNFESSVYLETLEIL